VLATWHKLKSLWHSFGTVFFAPFWEIYPYISLWWNETSFFAHFQCNDVVRIKNLVKINRADYKTDNKIHVIPKFPELNEKQHVSARAQPLGSGWCELGPPTFLVTRNLDLAFCWESNIRGDFDNEKRSGLRCFYCTLPFIDHLSLSALRYYANFNGKNALCCPTSKRLHKLR
jgi:hypothetical protein